jgi:hypothetical protein
MLGEMRRVVILCIGFLGCASTSSVTDTTVKARLNIELNGSAVQAYKFDRCVRTLQRRGGYFDTDAPVSAVLTLNPDSEGGNRLRIVSRRRGIVVDQRPGQLSIGELCDLAVAKAVPVAQAEPESPSVRVVSSVKPLPLAPPPASAPRVRPAVTSPPEPSRTLTTPAATEQPKAIDDGRAHFFKAMKAFNLAKFDEAIGEWSRAYELDGKPECLFNIGNAYRRRGEINGDVRDLREAHHFLKRYFDLTGEREADVNEVEREISHPAKK